MDLNTESVRARAATEKARSLYDRMLDVKVLLALRVLSYLTEQLRLLSQTLQSREISFAAATRAVEATAEHIQHEYVDRGDDFQGQLWQQVIDVQSEQSGCSLHTPLFWGEHPGGLGLSSLQYWAGGKIVHEVLHLTSERTINFNRAQRRIEHREFTTLSSRDKLAEQVCEVTALAQNTAQAVLDQMHRRFTCNVTQQALDIIQPSFWKQPSAGWSKQEEIARMQSAREKVQFLKQKYGRPADLDDGSRLPAMISPGKPATGCQQSCIT